MSLLLDISEDPFKSVFGGSRGLSASASARELSPEQLLWRTEQEGPIARYATSLVEKLLDNVHLGNDEVCCALLNDTASSRMTDGWQQRCPYASKLINGWVAHHLQPQKEKVSLYVKRMYEVYALPGYSIKPIQASQSIHDELTKSAIAHLEDTSLFDSNARCFSNATASESFGHHLGPIIQNHSVDILTALTGIANNSTTFDAQQWVFLAQSFYGNKDAKIEDCLYNMQDGLNKLSEEQVLLERISNPLQVEVLKLRYGMGGHKKYTLEETGVKLGITRERARMLQASALEDIREAFTLEEMDAVMGKYRFS